MGNGVFDGDFAVVFSQEVIEPLIVSRAQPIHRIVDDVLNNRMPGVILRQKMSIVDDVEHTMTVLERPKFVTLAISNTQNQVACSLGRFQSADGFIQRLVPLKDVSEHEGKWVSKPAFLSEGLVAEVNSDLTYGQFLGVCAGNDS